MNVKAYGAVGDGVADDTAAINAALVGTRSQSGRPPDYYSPRPRVVFFPAGTYRVSGMLTWVGINLTLRGAGRADTVIRLNDNAAGFADAAAPLPVIRCWRTANYGFAQNIRDLTVDTGSGNPGANGIEYNANNTGALQNVRVVGSGVAGIDMTQAWPGPCLVRDVVVEGFQVGIDLGGPEYGPTFEDVSVSGQSVAGFRNSGNVFALRGFTSSNSVPGILTTNGRSHAIVLDATFSGGAPSRSAIELAAGSTAYVRSISGSGYQSALKTGSTVVAGASQSERVVGTLRHLVGTSVEAQAKLSLKLPISETPRFHDNTSANWGRLQRTANTDITSGNRTANQAVFDDTSKSTVWVSCGTALAGDADDATLATAGFRVPAHIRRFTGFTTNFNKYSGSRPWGLVLRVLDDGAQPLIIDDCRGAVMVYHASARTVVLRNGQFSYVAAPGAGPLYLEDVGTNNITTVPGQRVWARQLNIEGAQLHLDNNGGDLWVFGLKTEFGGQVARTRNGGRTEFLGTLLYPLQPSGTAFENLDAHQSLSYVTSNYSGDYATQVSETRLGSSATVATGSAGQRFAMPLFVGWTSDRAAVAATGTLTGNTITLGARADGAGGAVTWTSQPSGVVFTPNGSSVAATTTATFPGPGTYQLTATFADGSSSTTVVTVPAADAGGGSSGGCGGGIFGAFGLLLVLAGMRLRRLSITS